MNKKQIVRVVIVPIVIGLLAGGMVTYDRNRVIADYQIAKTVLSDARRQSLADKKKRIALFRNKELIIKESDSIISNIHLRTLDSVNYDTTIGDDLIVFTRSGTSDYNKEIHGGDITFQSWFGFTKHLWVNCTGFITEGKMLEE